MTDAELEARGMALASQSLVVGIMRRLIERELLTNDDLAQIEDGCLSTLEGLPNDLSVQVARQFVEGVCSLGRSAPKERE
jgi:hypothetical protein